MPNCAELVKVEVVMVKPNSARINHLNAMQFMLQFRDFHAIPRVQPSVGIFGSLQQTIILHHAILHSHLNCNPVLDL
jgi:hypothetical protein